MRRSTSFSIKRLLLEPELKAATALMGLDSLVSHISDAQKRLQGPDPSFRERAERSERDNGWSALHHCHYEVCCVALGLMIERFKR